MERNANRFLLNTRLQQYGMIKEQFTTVFKEKKPLETLIKLLTRNETLELSLTSKQIHQLIKPYEPKQAFNKQQQKVPKQKPKNKSPPTIQVKMTDDTYKLSIFNIKTAPKHLFNQTSENWQYTGSVPEKLLQNIEQSYAGFKSKSGGKSMFFIHRGLIDRSLEYYRGGLDDEDEQNYQELYSGKQFTENFDFTSPESLRQRQRQLLSLLNQKQMEKQSKQLYQNEIQAEKIKDLKRISIILCFGGSFSLGIFENGKCILHKSDKKYVNRGKAGGRQLNRDKSSGSNIQSMGSQIRRHQQKLHQQNVATILQQCQKELSESDIIFLQAPGLNRKIIIENSEALCRLKGKLRSVCHSARKANYQNVEELYELLTKVYVLDVKQ